MNSKEKKKILGRIHAIGNTKSKEEKKLNYKRIFALIKQDTKKYTTNSYGHWVDLNNLSDDCLDKIKLALDEMMQKS